MLDELNSSIPVFVLINLSRLPRYDPEEVNVYPLIDRLAVLEHELTSFKQDVSMLKSQPPVIAPVKKVESSSFPNLYSGVVALPPVSSSTVSKSVSIDTCSRPPQDKLRSLPAANKPVSVGIAKKVDASSSNNFTLVTNKRQQRRIRPTVVGTKKDAEFHGCRPRVDLFVSRIPNEYSVEHVRKLITGIGIEVLALVKVSHVDALAASFKLSIYRDDEQKALDPGSWPEFVAVRRYIQRRRNVHRVQETQIKPIESNWDNDDPSMWDHLPDDE